MVLFTSGVVLAVSSLAVVEPPGTATSATSPAGPAVARLCERCHGPGGRSRTSRHPSLAGLAEDHLVARLHDFRNGQGPHLMASQARGLSDEQIAALAAYFSRLE